MMDAEVHSDRVVLGAFGTCAREHERWNATEPVADFLGGAWVIQNEANRGKAPVALDHNIAPVLRLYYDRFVCDETILDKRRYQLPRVMRCLFKQPLEF